MAENYCSYSDLEIIGKIAGEDKTAFAELYKRYSFLVYKVSLGIQRDREETQEVVQEVFLQIWKSAFKYDSSRGAVSTWLMNITRSRAIDNIRKHRYKMYGTQLVENMYFPGISELAELENENRELLNNALNTLPFEQKKAVKNVYFNGLTHDEASRKLNIPVGTIKTRIRLAIPKLRQILEPYFLQDETV